jgi:hypothetical protein
VNHFRLPFDGALPSSPGSASRDLRSRPEAEEKVRARFSRRRCGSARVDPLIQSAELLQAENKIIKRLPEAEIPFGNPGW